MKTKLTFPVFCFLFSLNFLSQEIPTIKVGEETISVKKLKVDVVVIGDIAITTFDMHFYNPNNRILEGELSFPLEENQTVTRFALDINGNLREAVVVEREKARVAFETTVRNKIDPALLEKTKGNNYKARIYPIPAKGYKRVVLAFQQKLLINNDAYFYKIPFNYQHELESFSFKMNVLNQNNKPVITKGFKNSFKYNSNSHSYTLKVESKKKSVSKPVLIQIPLNANKERVLANDNFFYFSKQLNLQKEKIDLENEITIFWDKSLSQKNKKIETELDFLNKYFKEVPNCRVRLIAFNTEIREEKYFEIRNTNWVVLKNKLANMVYDGASSFNFLNHYNDNSKLNLLFTDGLNTLSSLKVELNKKTHIINSSVSANHAALRNLVSTNGGTYINLQQISINNAFEKITKKQIQFLGTNISEDFLEVYPKKGTTIQTDFSISGKGNNINKNIKLFFGTKNDTLKTVDFTIDKNSQNDFIAKIWAEKKINFLNQQKDKNEKEIVDLSKEYQVISDFTSMLILDRVEDYVMHAIEPPKELKNKYDELVARKINNEKERLASLKSGIFQNYQDFFNWYDKDYRVFEKKKIALNQVLDTTPISVREQNLGFTVSGFVSDESQFLPGVNVHVKNKTIGSQTDFDGNYTIDVEVGDVLVYSYLGFEPKEITITNQRTINVFLKESANQLDEIVVVGYGTRVSTSVTGSVSTIKAENISQSIAGQVAGVNIINSNRQPGVATNIVIRGAGSVQSNSEPIYVVDGIVVSNPSQINPDDVESTYVLNPEQSSSLYGSRGSNGVVVITTKKGGRKNAAQIAEFEKLVTDKIELKGWNPKTPYLKILNRTKNIHEAYQTYLELREKYQNSPSFYVDVADFFKEKNQEKIAVQILTNVAEIDLDNYELLKALAYKFEEYELYEFAIYTYKEILNLRPEDIQSYRDLALAYQNVEKYQESLELLYKIVNGELLLKDEARRFSGIEIIALNELNRLISLHPDVLEINHIDKDFIKNTKTDVRVVIDWNHNDTDIDLWVTDPNDEKCFYSHKKTKIGGLMSDDMTQGFGPEQFILKEAIQGKYKINVKYFANSQQKISGPTFLKITIFKNYGSKNEIKETKLLRLTKVDAVLDIGTLEF